MIISKHRFLLIPVLAAFVLGLAGAAYASPGSASAIIDEVEDEAYTGVEVGQRECHGGVQKWVHMEANDRPSTIGESGAFVGLVGYTFNVPAGDNDLIDVTFSAEGSLVNHQIPNVVPADFVQLAIMLDGAMMHPLNDLAFSSRAYRADATQACQRVGQGNHTVTVVWRLVDQDMNDVLTGVIDDWELKIQVHN
jgi:hypothetical protein